MQNIAFSQWLCHFQEQAKALLERRLILLVGDDEWANHLLNSVHSFPKGGEILAEKSWLIYGDSELIEANIPPKRFRDILGTESDYVICTHQSLSVDAVAALSGTLVAGGIFFLVINDISLFKQSNFFKRFYYLLNGYSEHVILKQEEFFLPVFESIKPVDIKREINTEVPVGSQTLMYGCVTQEQVSAVDAITKVVRGKSKRPLVLTADRGRGKSSALAIACAQLLLVAKNDNKLHIIITAADRSAVKIFFEQLEKSLPQGHLDGSRFIVLNGLVEFVAVDQLLLLQKAVSLVLVDEAAAIPVYILKQLLLRHSRIAFSSTVHGYEGAGRGFTIKFQQILNRLLPHWRSFHINEPIRWRLGDPLEQLIFDSCLLNAELPSLPSSCSNIKKGKVEFKCFTGEDLLANEQLLRQVFSVLVTAHYQTKPSDVQMLLDNEQVQLVCLMSTDGKREQVIAVALLMHEGNYTEQKVSELEVAAINKAEKRLRNNFIPQSLLTQCGVEKAFDYHYVRVMRIAVHPQLQNKGFGSLLLKHIAQFVKATGSEFLASSFGATQPLLSFWLNAGFKLGRIGFNKDKASGEHSALIIKSLTDSSDITLSEINSEFYRQFDYLLVDEYKYLEPNLVALVQQHCPLASLMTLTSLDIANIEAFAYGYRQYSSCVFSLHLWLKQQLCKQNILEDVANIFICRVMQKHCISDVCSAYHFTGKKELEHFLRQSVVNTLAVNS